MLGCKTSMAIPSEKSRVDGSIMYEFSLKVGDMRVVFGFICHRLGSSGLVL
jgi:hypothetical protein